MKLRFYIVLIVSPKTFLAEGGAVVVNYLSILANFLAIHPYAQRNLSLEILISIIISTW